MRMSNRRRQGRQGKLTKNARRRYTRAFATCWASDIPITLDQYCWADEKQPHSLSQQWRFSTFWAYSNCFFSSINFAWLANVNTTVFHRLAPLIINRNLLWQYNHYTAQDWLLSAESFDRHKILLLWLSDEIWSSTYVVRNCGSTRIFTQIWLWIS